MYSGGGQVTEVDPDRETAGAVWMMAAGSPFSGDEAVALAVYRVDRAGLGGLDDDGVGIAAAVDDRLPLRCCKRQTPAVIPP